MPVGSKSRPRARSTDGNGITLYDRFPSYIDMQIAAAPCPMRLGAHALVSRHLLPCLLDSL